MSKPFLPKRLLLVPQGEGYYSRARQTILSKTVGSETDRSEKVLSRQRGGRIDTSSGFASLSHLPLIPQGHLLRQPNQRFGASLAGEGFLAAERARQYFRRPLEVKRTGLRKSCPGSEARKSTPHPASLRSATFPSRGRLLQPSEAEHYHLIGKAFFPKKPAKRRHPPARPRQFSKPDRAFQDESFPASASPPDAGFQRRNNPDFPGSSSSPA